MIPSLKILQKQNEFFQTIFHKCQIYLSYIFGLHCDKFEFPNQLAVSNRNNCISFLYVVFLNHENSNADWKVIVLVWNDLKNSLEYLEKGVFNKILSFIEKKTSSRKFSIRENYFYWIKINSKWNRILIGQKLFLAEYAIP